MNNGWVIRKAKIYLSQQEYNDLIDAADAQEYVTDDEYSHEVLFPDGRKVQVGLYSYWDGNDSDSYITIFYVELLNEDGLVIDANDNEEANKEIIDTTWAVEDRTKHVRYYTYFAVKDNQVLVA